MELPRPPAGTTGQSPTRVRRWRAVSAVDRGRSELVGDERPVPVLRVRRVTPHDPDRGDDRTADPAEDDRARDGVRRDPERERDRAEGHGGDE
jgi:hypothetical protein